MSGFCGTSQATPNNSMDPALEKPTMGEKIKAAFSSKTAEEIHAENLAKKQGQHDTNMEHDIKGPTSGTTTGAYGGQPAGSTMGSTLSSRQYDNTAAPSVGDKLKAAPSYKTDDQIHAEGQMRDRNYGTQNTTAGTTAGSTVSQSNYDNTSQPSMGDKMKAAFSSKTAQEIHEENRMKDLNRAGNQAGTMGNVGTGTMDQSGYGSNNQPAGSTLGSTFSSRQYDNTAAPSIGDKLKAAPSYKTDDQIHAEGQMQDRGYGSGSGWNATGTTAAGAGLAGTTVGSTLSQRNYDNTSQPSIGDKLQAAGSSRTSQQIHDDTVARDLGGKAAPYGSTATTSTTAPYATNSSASSTLPTSSGSSSNLSQGPNWHSDTTSSLSSGRTATETGYTVGSVAQDAYSQIAMQEREALAKADKLRQEDEARLLSSSGTAKAELDRQAMALKQKIEQEKLAAEAEIATQQATKVNRTNERSELEKQAIHQAAVQRRAELEAKQNKLQSEIDELVRLKAQEMMAEKPGDLQFRHESQDVGIIAKLSGQVKHQLGLEERQQVTNSVTQGHVQHQPVQVTKQYESGPAAANTNTQSYTREGQWRELPSHSATGGASDQGWTGLEGQSTQGSNTTNQYHDVPSKASTLRSSGHPNTYSSTTEQRQALADSKRNV